MARVPLLVFGEKSFIELPCTDGQKPILLCVEQSDKAGIYTVIGPDGGGRTFTNTSLQPLPPVEMTKVYLASGISDLNSPTAVYPRFPCNSSRDAPFHFSFITTHASPYAHTRVIVDAQNVEESWIGDSPAAILLRRIQASIHVVVVIQCGICMVSPLDTSSRSHRVHWARVLWTDHRSGTMEHLSSNEHDCTKDHIADWKNWRRRFLSPDDGSVGTQAVCEVELSFVDSKMYRDTLVLHSVSWDERFVPSDATNGAGKLFSLLLDSLHSTLFACAIDSITSTLVDTRPTLPSSPDSAPATSSRVPGLSQPLVTEPPRTFPVHHTASSSPSRIRRSARWSNHCFSLSAVLSKVTPRRR